MMGPLTNPEPGANLQAMGAVSTIIGVSGKARAGKDTFFSLYASRGYEKASFAAELKSRVRRDFGLTVEDTDGRFKDAGCRTLEDRTPRQLLIDYGNLFRKYNPNYWCEALFNTLDTKPGRYVITDVRYPNEAEYIKSRGGILIRLERHPDRDGMVDAVTKTSISETALDEYKGWDLCLPAEYNRTPEDLEVFASIVDDHLEDLANGEE